MFTRKKRVAMALLPKSKPEMMHEGTSRAEFPEHIVLDDASFDAFSASVTNPPRPNAKLRALFQKK
jgi:hypothetical protein